MASCFSGGLQASPEKLTADPARLWQQRVPLFGASKVPEVPTVQFEKPLVGVVGPRSLSERLCWADNLWSRLSPLQRDVLVWNLQRVSSTSDSFCGMGSREQLTVQILKCVNAATGLGLDVRRARAFSVCESDPHKQAFLSTFGQLQPVHATSDIMDRLGFDLKQQIRGLMNTAKSGQASATSKKFMNQRIKSLLESSYTCSAQKFAHAPCLHHRDLLQCPVSPVAAIPSATAETDNDICWGSEDVLRIRTAAPPCIDVSAMNAQQPGDAGPSFAATQCFLIESPPE